MGAQNSSLYGVLEDEFSRLTQNRKNRINLGQILQLRLPSSPWNLDPSHLGVLFMLDRSRPPSLSGIVIKQRLTQLGSCPGNYFMRIWYHRSLVDRIENLGGSIGLALQFSFTGSRIYKRWRKASSHAISTCSSKSDKGWPGLLQSLHWFVWDAVSYADKNNPTSECAHLSGTKEGESHSRMFMDLWSLHNRGPDVINSTNFRCKCKASAQYRCGTLWQSMEKKP